MLKERVANHIKTYEEPELDDQGNPMRREHRPSMEEEKLEDEDMDQMKKQMPLQEGVLKVNMGIPIVVVCSKIDLLMKEDAAERQLEKNLDFI